MNTYSYFTNIIVGLLEGNIGTLDTHNSTLDLYTSTSQELSQAWTSGEPDPNSQIWKDYQAMLTAPKGSNDLMAQFINDYMQGDNHVDFFSALFGTQLMSALSSSNIWDSTHGPAQMNEINQWNSMIGSIAQNQENKGQNGVKSESSVLQSDAGAQQPLSDAGTAGLSIFGNDVQLLQKTFS